MLNIIGYDENNKFFMPIIGVIISNKSYIVYNKVFKEIIYLFEQYKLHINSKDKVINYDF